VRPLERMFGAWTAVVLVFLYLPIAILVAYSFNTSKLNILWEGFTLEWYRMVWRDAVLLRSLENSLRIALVTTVVSVVLGTSGAWLLHRYRFPARRLWRTLVYVPMLVPEVAMGVSLLILFVVVHLELGFTSVIISHVTFCFPFVLVAVEARLAGLDPSLEEAALDLGATPSEAFRKVLVPYLMPAVVSGALMAFSLSLDELIVTYFTASAGSKTLPIEIFGRVKKGLDPSLNAISTMFILLTVVLVVATGIVRRRGASISPKPEEAS
jgi:spermidine/putrescine transport system permease protein